MNKTNLIIGAFIFISSMIPYLYLQGFFIDFVNIMGFHELAFRLTMFYFEHFFLLDNSRWLFNAITWFMVLFSGLGTFIIYDAIKESPGNIEGEENN